MNERLKEIRRITITTTRRRTLRIQSVEFRTICPICEREVATLTPGEAGAVLEVDALALGRLLSAGTVHVVQTVSGSLRICHDSLFE